MRRKNWNTQPTDIRHHIMRLSVPKLFFSRQKGSKTKKSENASICRVKLSVNGASAFLSNALMASKINQGPGDRAVFPPKVVVAVKAIACELPSQRGLPFSRFSHNDIAQEAIRCGIVASISGATVWRWLSADAIKPWLYRS
jgi:hypothetical protein